MNAHAQLLAGILADLDNDTRRLTAAAIAVAYDGIPLADAEAALRQVCDDDDALAQFPAMRRMITSDDNKPFVDILSSQPDGDDALGFATAFIETMNAMTEATSGITSRLGDDAGERPEDLNDLTSQWIDEHGIDNARRISPLVCHLYGLPAMGFNRFKLVGRADGDTEDLTELMLLDVSEIQDVLASFDGNSVLFETSEDIFELNIDKIEFQGATVIFHDPENDGASISFVPSFEFDEAHFVGVRDSLISRWETSILAHGLVDKLRQELVQPDLPSASACFLGELITTLEPRQTVIFWHGDAVVIAEPPYAEITIDQGVIRIGEISIPANDLEHDHISDFGRDFLRFKLNGKALHFTTPRHPDDEMDAVVEMHDTLWEKYRGHALNVRIDGKEHRVLITEESIGYERYDDDLGFDEDEVTGIFYIGDLEFEASLFGTRGMNHGQGFFEGILTDGRLLTIEPVLPPSFFQR